ncbi:hypothetical protein CIPAW_03G161500 [Carya illinoinensis]|uniref:Reverse transcriptase zinc-binding domain-containing protein n=1 Tax=Carya illinoinensis TaxID=32201 RepID=A0A8T1R1Q0_CARIL|nr:hypothetical protein CIPAW_03G161500 [Carya illinoinensis]
MFLWKACNDSLPTFKNLQKRKVTEDKMCPICHLEEESVTHVLWSCGAAQDVWCQASRQLQKLSLEGTLFESIWGQLYRKLPKPTLEEAGMILRLIWSRRNDYVHGKELRHPKEIINKAHEDLQCFRESNSKVLTATLPACHQSPQRWKKPPDDRYKMNWDAVVNTSKNLIGIGAIISDYNGLVLGTIISSLKL